MNRELFSAIDACLNRAMEGVRVCEDVARFSWKMIDCSTKLKEMRHRILKTSSIFKREYLLDARDVDGDSQKFVDSGNEKFRISSADIFSANLHRAIEAVRSLEEFYKTYDLSGENPFQIIRFELYNLEKEIFPVIVKYDKMAVFENSLYAILDSTFVSDGEYINTARKLISGGVSILQLRMKNCSRREVLSTAKDISSLCKEEGAVFIVNDYPDIAILSDSDGVHLGQDDLPLKEAKKILPFHMITGVSTHSCGQAIEAQQMGPDYIAAGPVFDTATKYGEMLKGIGLEELRRVRMNVSCPVVAIGGINSHNVNDVIESGVRTPVLVSELYAENNIEGNCHNIVQMIK